jgi:hypothetical protein
MALVGPTLVLYAVVGIGVAIAVYLSGKRGDSAEILFRVAMALPFWPLYIPVLLAHVPASARAHFGHGHGHGLGQGENDDMSAAISQIDAELEAALNSLDGWAEDVLAREKDRIRELRAAWIAQADRIREMDHLLAVLAPTLTPAPTLTLLAQSETRVGAGAGAGARIAAEPEPLMRRSAQDSPAKNRLVQSQEACQHNINRLRLVRQRTYDDLLSNLAWVRELVSMIHLAKFTGAPASRAEELVAQIAAAVEGLADVTWREEPTVSADGNTSVPE